MTESPPSAQIPEAGFRPFSRRTLTVLALSLALLGALLATNFMLRHAVPDDAYIYLRVASQWVSGLDYNAGNPVSPSTSTGYPLLLGACLAIFSMVPQPAVMITLHVVLTWIFASIILLNTQRYGRWVAALIVLIVISENNFVQAIGMDSALLLCVACCSAWALSADRPYLATFLAGSCFLARPEGVGMLAVVCFVLLLRTRKIPLLPGLIGCVIPALNFGVTRVTTGNWFPHTVQIKSVQSGIGYWGEQPSWFIAWITEPSVPVLTWGLCLLGLVQLGRGLLKQEDTFISCLVLFGFMQGVAYSVLEAPVGYAWYFVPANLAVNLCVFFGIRYLVTKWIPKDALKPAVLGLCAVLQIVVLGAVPFEIPKPYRLAKEYKDISLWIRENTPEDFQVAAVEIGYIGYYSQRPIVDPNGLLHAESLPHLKEEKWWWWFDTYNPEVIITKDPRPWCGEPQEGVWPEEVLRAFDERYEKRIHSGRMVVYLRRDALKT